ncbi:GntR family transcriptional regulator [Peptoniphilus sp. MSJ-1]|uniref:GntR family transcriptional regulator n=1 Tax=Peptoniphilus ovalis TaxID=2841503 RepID=A0ABS6FEN0_9FIRM|nr:GntR family transcriptional regulator [Peptoniphilus ovalis]MBU5668630.1 GntR family transcriptional regulator [Peptoniphilus ovalis]
MSNQDIFSNSDQIVKRTYKDQAYNLIKNAILYNKFRIGATYSQQEICDELGISRTPVREALLELQKEGYVSFARGKGVEVVPVTDETAHDILETRLILEGINAKIAAERRTDEDIKYIYSCLGELKKNLSTFDGQALYRIDHQFHRSIARATHNKILYNQTELILDNYLRFENKSVYNNSIDGNNVFKEHEMIANAINEGNSDKSKKLMENHLKESYSRTLNRFWEY